MLSGHRQSLTVSEFIGQAIIIIIHPQYEKKDGIRKEEIRGYQETDGPVNRQINCPQMVVMALFLTRAAAPA